MAINTLTWSARLAIFPALRRTPTPRNREEAASLFHVTMTPTEDNCPGYNPEQMPNVLEAGERLPTIAKDLGVTVHSLVWGAPEHVAFALLESDSIGAINQFVNSIPIRRSRNQ